MSTKFSFWLYSFGGLSRKRSSLDYFKWTQICFLGFRPSDSAPNIHTVSNIHAEGRSFAISPNIVFSKLGLVWVLAICRAGIFCGDGDCAWGWLGGNCRLRLQHDSAGILKSVDDSQSSPNRGEAGGAEFQLPLKNQDTEHKRLTETFKIQLESYSITFVFACALTPEAVGKTSMTQQMSDVGFDNF